jgi:hypothetical protein
LPASGIALSSRQSAWDEGFNVRSATTSFRKRLATFLVVLYAFCVLAPHAAMALVHAGNLVHCFTEAASSGHEHAMKTHVHDDGAAHQHDQAADPATSPDEKGAQTACCGLFAVPGLVAETRTTPRIDGHGEAISSQPDKSLADHPPGRLIKPPIA